MTMKTEGITIEKLSIGWLQILIAVFALGGFTYTTTHMYTTLISVKKGQDKLFAEYVPVIDRLDRESALTNNAVIALTTSIQEFNINLKTVLVLRDKEEDDKKLLSSQVRKLNDDVVDLKAKVHTLID
jgi:hypothetical protein